MVLSLGAPAFAEGGKSPVFKDGAAQSILQYTNLRGTNYTNEGSDILRFCVYVETDHDTDGDGKADLVEALVQVPLAHQTNKIRTRSSLWETGSDFVFSIGNNSSPTVCPADPTPNREA